MGDRSPDIAASWDSRNIDHEWNEPSSLALNVGAFEELKMGRGLLLWLLGVPIPVIILLWLFFGH